MLAAAHRLRRSSDFAATVKRGRRAGRGAVVVHLVTPTDPPDAVSTTPTPDPTRNTGPQPHRGPVRVGFVVSKTVGGAVCRNTVRRRLRHLIRDRVPHLPNGASLVIRALPAAARTPYPRLAADLDAALAAASSPRRPRGGRA